MRVVSRFSLLLGAVTSFGIARAAAVAGYDPLAAVPPPKPQTLELKVRDERRGREIPLLVYLPGEGKPAPVILYSHGLGGNRYGSAFLGRHWSARGFAVVFLQHPGSDDGVWKDLPPARRMEAMRAAASGQSFIQRVADVPRVLDQLEQWNKSVDHPLAGRLDLAHLGMSGHSFGAVTTQAVSGQVAASRGALFTDRRIQAAIAFSPSTPRGGDARQAFGQVRIPWLLMTGTRDLSVIGDADLASRLAVYPALPPGDKYELVLKDAEHSAFTDRPLPGDTQKRNPNHHRAILAISTAFWDAMLRDDTAARKWLTGDGPRGVLEQDDRWQHK